MLYIAWNLLPLIHELGRTIRRFRAIKDDRINETFKHPSIIKASAHYSI